MKPIVIVIVIASIVVSFTAGYLTGSFRQRQEDDTKRKDAARKAGSELRDAEKSFDDAFKIPDAMPPRKKP